MKWHQKTIDEMKSRLDFLRNRVTINTNHGNQPGPDIEIIFTNAGEQRRINVEIQQFDSGAPWKSQTIPGWKQRHDFATLIIFPEPIHERVLDNKEKEYDFFRQRDVFLFHDKQLEDVISLIIKICI